MELVSENIKYSFCTTVYNSVETIQRFYDSISKSMTENSELVIVDSFSKDGTYEKLLEIKEKDPRVKVIRKKCWRGKGKQVSIENSKGEIIIVINDADGEYYNINKYIEDFEKNYENKLVSYGVGVNGFNMGFVIAKKDTLYFLGGFPNLNNSDDAYLYKVAECLGLLVTKTISINDVKPIPIKGLSSGNEKRYANNKLEALKRRLIATRDILFVNDFKPFEFIKWYKLKGIKKYVIGYSLYAIGKLIRFTIKDEKPLKRCKHILYKK